ncbi:arsenical pump-driving ATPase [Mariniblastus fucicola]|uniref:arsenite-transporting ATPase n=1 Tax=Mariniblastus fucicola TaxID=980251 RepID=A0A5B9PFY5_9BACT|nr:arsenical pump-driving ATPase [Mariniblastus fucicola]QEG21733.1 Arsenical pump-driving ATPase [Mariniblastus fucicola]
MKLFENPTRNLFFTGKGGVGKTSMACATAVQLAEQGKRVLLVSTDPASNLHDVLATEIKSTPTPINGVENLQAMNIDPVESARLYRERMIGPYRGVLPESAVASMEEQLSGSCTVEIAAFDEFSRLLGDADSTSQYDHVVFDTAPTGHTLRLLTLPSAWSGFMDSNTTGTSCLGPLAGLQDQKLIYQKSVDALSDGNATTLVLVTRPETSALREAAETSGELQHLGIKNQRLIVNGVFTAASKDDQFAAAMESRCQKSLDTIPAAIESLPRTSVPLLATSLMGVDALRQVGNPDAVHEVRLSNDVLEDLPIGLGGLVEDISASGHGVVMTMGKGGVGKTTVAASIAVALAGRGHNVLLSTTDPAAHLVSTMATENLPNLTVSRIDPAEEVEQYKAEVMATAGSDLDEQGRALLEEDLRSPCTEEIAVFRAFARAVAEGGDHFVVLDTAPTGHTVLLLDSALAYHREVTRHTTEMPEYVQELLPRLRDPKFARMLIVALPEATPVHEATQLQEDLRRAEIEPYAWVINQSFQSLDVSDPVLLQRKQNEVPFVREVRDSLSNRLAILPWQKESPTGLENLRRLADELIAS